MKTVYLIISIILIATLVAVFIISFLINKKTPKPKGCEDLEVTEENCLNCGRFDCKIRDKFIDKENLK
ncbi:MAG: hypothetical protein K5892_06355 [Acholeplasmatales bacterium]|jgi:hypothetical protein|nr:hypothetical protein [Acholeplasmatales bacterium]